MWLRRLAAPLLVVVLGALLAACGEEASGDDAVDAAIYAEVVLRVSGSDDAEEDLPIVFVRPAPGHSIDLGVQAEVVKLLEKQISVRFVDEDDEVILVDEPLEPVRDGAVVVTLGEIDRVGSHAQVHATSYRDRRHSSRHCIDLRREDDLWRSAEVACNPTS